MVTTKHLLSSFESHILSFIFVPLFTVYKQNIQNIIMNSSNQEASWQFGSMNTFSINEHEPKILWLLTKIFQLHVYPQVMKRNLKDNLVHLTRDSDQSKGIKDEKFLSNMRTIWQFVKPVNFTCHIKYIRAYLFYKSHLCSPLIT